MKNPKERRLNQLFLKVNRQDAATKQNNFCFFCTEPLNKNNISADHYLPKSKGGTDNKKNIKASCIECNQTKGSLSAGEFKKYIRNPAEYCRYDNKRFYIHMAWSRRKIWLKYHRTTKNLGKHFGVDIPQPK